jgi:hypothetical protein
MLNEVKGQWVAFLSFIEDFIQELTSVAKFQKDKAWNLVARCIAALFAEMRAARAGVVLLEQVDTLQAKSAIVWASLQTHRTMNEFGLLHFKGHHTVIKEMSLFMVTERVDPSELASFVDKCAKAEAAGNKAMEVAKKTTMDLKTLENKHETLYRAHGQLKQELATFKEKVAKKLPT